MEEISIIIDYPSLIKPNMKISEEKIKSIQKLNIVVHNLILQYKIKSSIKNNL